MVVGCCWIRTRATLWLFGRMLVLTLPVAREVCGETDRSPSSAAGKRAGSAGGRMVPAGFGGPLNCPMALSGGMLGLWEDDPVPVTPGKLAASPWLIGAGGEAGVGAEDAAGIADFDEIILFKPRRRPKGVSASIASSPGGSSNSPRTAAGTRAAAVPAAPPTSAPPPTPASSWPPGPAPAMEAMALASLLPARPAPVPRAVASG